MDTPNLEVLFSLYVLGKYSDPKMLSQWQESGFSFWKAWADFDPQYASREPDALREWMHEKQSTSATDNIIVVLLAKHRDNPIAVQIFQLVKDHLLEVADSAKLVKGILTFNLELLQETDWPVNGNLRLLYSNEYNQERSELRYSMEAHFPDRLGWWEHLEQFCTLIDVPRLEQEGAQEALKRHLLAGTLPMMDVLKKLWALPEKELAVLEFLQTVSFEEACLFERLLASVKQEDAAAADTMNARQWKLVLLRAMNRWQHESAAWPSETLTWRLTHLQRCKKLADALRKQGIGKTALDLTGQYLEFIESGADLVQIWQFCRDRGREDLAMLAYDQYWEYVEPELEEVDRFPESVFFKIVGASIVPGQPKTVQLASSKQWNNTEEARLLLFAEREENGILFFESGVSYGGADYEQDVTAEGLDQFIHWLRENQVFFSIH